MKKTLIVVDPDNRITVDGSCCAGVTPQTHEAALETMKMCQIEVNNSSVGLL